MSIEDHGSCYFTIKKDAQDFEIKKKNEGCWTCIQGILTGDFTRIDKYKVIWEKITEKETHKMPDGHYLDENGRSVVVYGEY